MPDLTDVYRTKSPSYPAKAAVALVHGCAVLAVGWLLFCGGTAHALAWLGWHAELAGPWPRALLLGASVVYFLRLLVTLFVFMRRRMGRREAATIAVWVGALQLLFAFLGGRQTALEVTDVVGACLYAAGSLLNSGAELQRFMWKRRPENRERLYTRGFFRYAMHINFDLVLFTGWVLLTGCWAFLAVPGLMLLGFVFVNIPAQDRYLAERYGDDYKAYAARTRKLVPFVY